MGYLNIIMERSLDLQLRVLCNEDTFFLKFPTNVPCWAIFDLSENNSLSSPGKVVSHEGGSFKEVVLGDHSTNFSCVITHQKHGSLAI